MIKSQESDLSSEKNSIDSQIAGYNKELDKLKKKEDDITPSLDQEILFKFQRIIQRNTEGIVAVKNGVCTGCHMILPAQFANTVREGENILFCPYCSRILFYEESEDGDSETYYTFDNSGDFEGLDDYRDEEEDMEEEDHTEDLYDKESEFDDDNDIGSDDEDDLDEDEESEVDSEE